MRAVCGFAIAMAAMYAAGVEYFPSGSLGETPREHQLRAHWYSLASDGTGLLTSKETNGKSGSEPETLIRNTVERLSKEQAQLFRDWLTEFRRVTHSG
jgi:hypothetical protein